MARIFLFPSKEDQEIIRTAVEVFLTSQTGMARKRMLKTIRYILDRYRISHFCFHDYIVEATKAPGFSVIRARDLISGRKCPWCGELLYGRQSKVRILSIQEHRDYQLVTYGCRCGRVFAKYEN